MITKYEYTKTTTGKVLTEITHIMSEHGHFEKNGKKQGFHIALGSGADPTVYTEVIDPGVTHELPENFPDIIVPDEEETEETDGETDEGGAD